ncbi:DNA mismatch endonuclease Vsr [Acinetobacter baumannii]|nr:DNA mismatch endonuclease Vsr [Acinetobacter baumannii]
MVDQFDTATRSRIMAAIKSRNTTPELLIRSMLHRRGFRFRLHVKDLPGKPDIVLPKYHSVIFINGCFWHGHSNCRLYKLPRTRTEYWKNKVDRNQLNDRRSIELLRAKNWRVCVIWECKIKAEKKNLNELIDIISDFLNSVTPFLEIRENLEVISEINS